MHDRVQDFRGCGESSFARAVVMSGALVVLGGACSVRAPARTDAGLTVHDGGLSDAVPSQDASIDAGGELGDGAMLDAETLDAASCRSRAPVAETASVALSRGHTDVLALHFDCESQTLAIFVADDTSHLIEDDLARAPASVLVHGNADTRLVVPDEIEPAFEDVVGPPGTVLWVLPEVQLETAVWPGLQAYGVPPGALEDDSVTLRLVSMEGPGSFRGFVTGVAGPEVIFDLSRGQRTMALAAGSHVHLNWMFTTEGMYRMTFEATGTLVDGTEITSPPQTLRFWLGEIASVPAAEPTVVRVECLAPSYAIGDDVALTAERSGAPSGLPYRWERQCQDSMTLAITPWEMVGEGASYALVAGQELGCQYRAALVDGARYVAVSQPVGVTIGG